MDTSMIKDPNMKLKHPSINTPSPTFLLHNGFGSCDEVSDIEMIKIQSVSYTSLKDLLLSSPRTLQPGRISSPTTGDGCCWWSEEIPIKNPLVKHAALAYLQPMSSPTAAVEKAKCVRESGCVFWLYDVVWRNVKTAVWESREVVYDEDEVD
ncbi:hypothetical protein HRI_004479500 [Hibiscus trionum]|uniref:Uncharacterized protein n=1 Tax=Hibiscus trionum TaxID=183268 RepID=A0A9W7J4P9_HIBTR|nr:hypothetical protein HRI_004479500 [Hibiscus trionum]